MAADDAGGLFCCRLHRRTHDAGYGIGRCDPWQGCAHYTQQNGGLCPLYHVYRQIYAPASHALGVGFYLCLDMGRFRICTCVTDVDARYILGWRRQPGQRIPVSFSMHWSRLSMTLGQLIVAAWSVTVTVPANMPKSNTSND